MESIDGALRYLPGKSFGRLVKRLRGKTSLPTIADRARLDALYLANVEAGRVPVDRAMAEHIISKGFRLDAPDTRRLLLGVELYDLGLTDNAIRQLVEDVILGTAPKEVLTDLRRLYHGYGK